METINLHFNCLLLVLLRMQQIVDLVTPKVFVLSNWFYFSFSA